MAVGYLALIGGGAEDDPGVSPSWSASAYGWIVERAKKGKIAIVAASLQTDFLTIYLVSLGASSAINLTIPDSATASSHATVDALSDCQPTAPPLALLLDAGSTVTTGASLVVGGGAKAPSVIVLDGSQRVEIASTPYAPRQSVALVGMRAHLLAGGWSFASGAVNGP